MRTSFGLPFDTEMEPQAGGNSTAEKHSISHTAQPEKAQPDEISEREPQLQHREREKRRREAVLIYTKRGCGRFDINIHKPRIARIRAKMNIRLISSLLFLIWHVRTRAWTVFVFALMQPNKKKEVAKEIDMWSRGRRSYPLPILRAPGGIRKRGWFLNNWISWEILLRGARVAGDAVKLIWRSCGVFQVCAEWRYF